MCIKLSEMKSIVYDVLCIRKSKIGIKRKTLCVKECLSVLVQL